MYPLRQTRWYGAWKHGRVFVVHHPAWEVPDEAEDLFREGDDSCPETRLIGRASSPRRTQRRTSLRSRSSSAISTRAARMRPAPIAWSATRTTTASSAGKGLEPQVARAEPGTSAQDASGLRADIGHLQKVAR